MPTFTKEAIVGLLKLQLSKQDLEVYDQWEKGELEYWDGGNADDTFSLGMEVGAIDELKRIINLIEEIN